MDITKLLPLWISARYSPFMIIVVFANFLSWLVSCNGRVYTFPVIVIFPIAGDISLLCSG
jgi:hypothetical protein